MNTKHTEGKLVARPTGLIATVEGNVVFVADIRRHGPASTMTEEDRANAERLALAWNLLTELPALLPDPTKLRIIASHFDLKDLITGATQSEVQDDLRQWARNIESILAKATNPNSGVTQAFPKGSF